MQKILDHKERALSELYEQYKDHPNLEKLLEAVAAGEQEVEDVLWAVLNAHLLPSATGAALDAIGSMAEESRAGRSDSEYRAAIQAKQALLMSKGRADDILFALKYMTGGTVVRIIESQAPASLILFTNFGYPPPALKQSMKQVVSGGVGVMILHTFTDFSNYPEMSGFEPIAFKELGGADPLYGKPFSELDGSFVGGMICETL
jgi:hypothetical protein